MFYTSWKTNSRLIIVLLNRDAIVCTIQYKFYATHILDYNIKKLMLLFSLEI